ncbi:MoxR family ATPase [Candidatus Woesearchaeota archaeon]|nr:MoxR family ATPase [Candidatus Woesearchaeota archaeon]
MPRKRKEFKTEINERLPFYKKKIEELRKEIRKIVVGQEKVINSLIEALLCNGHVLVEGVPGIAKTLIVRTLAAVTGGSFSRIQFTPDLLPSDIIGITTYEEGKGFYTIKGPIFANFVLADEINRAPPKVQSALLEAMQERQATIGKQTYSLPHPFLVMATQNPIESLGTYKLPEAQLDRFMYKVLMTYPTFEEEILVLNNNITTKKFEEYNIQVVLDVETIKTAQEDIKKVYTSKKVETYIVRIIDATRRPEKYGIELGKYIEYGASPRGSISLYLASKAHALIDGRGYVTPQDVKEVAKRVLRHRIILTYEGEAEEITSDEIIDEILKKVPIIH